MDVIIKAVNAELLPYKRISRFKVLDEAMEMTTTQKIKRFKVAEVV
jgi:long-chain acyl-CoA synthetase